MKYVIRGEKVEVTKPIKEYLIEKLSKLDKYLENPELVQAKIVIMVRGREHKVEVTIPYKSYCVRSEVSHSDMYASIDLMIDKIERQFKKYKTKNNTKKQSKKIEDIEEYFEESKENIVKRKELFLKPIDEEEATIQMELSEHDFYIFKNIENNSICVLYKRKEKDYGLIKVN